MKTIEKKNENKRNKVILVVSLIALMAIFYSSIFLFVNFKPNSFKTNTIKTNVIKTNTTSIIIPKTNTTKVNITKVNTTKVNTTEINTTKVNITKTINVTKINTTNVTKSNSTEINTSNNTKVSNVIFLYPSQTSYYFDYVPIFGNKTEVGYICNGLNMTFYNYNESNVAFESFNSIYTFKGQMEYARFGYDHPKQINKNNLIYYCN